MREEMKRFFGQPFFWMAAGGMMLSFLLISVPEWMVIDLPLSLEYRSPALVMAVTPVWFGGFMLLMPLCCAIACVPSQVEELQSGYAQWQVIRSSIARYIAQKATVGAMGGFAVCAGTFWLHALLWNVIALPINVEAYPNHIQYLDGFFGEWYHVAYGLPMYAWIGVGAGLCGGMMAIMGLAVAAWIPDHLIAVTLSMAVYFFWSYDLFALLFGIKVPHPSYLYNSYITWERTAQCLLTNGIIALVSLLIYSAGVKRRLQHG